MHGHTDIKKTSLYSTLKFEAGLSETSAYLYGIKSRQSQKTVLYSVKLVYPKRRHICMALKVVTSQKTVLYSVKLVYPKRRHICLALKVVTSQKTALFIHIKESCISNGLQRAESENGNFLSGERILRIAKASLFCHKNSPSKPDASSARPAILSNFFIQN